MSLFLKTMDPFRDLRDLEKRFSTVFPTQPDADRQRFMPMVNTRESDDAYHIEMDVPGVKKDDIQVEVKNNQLIVSGERKVKEELKEADYYRQESRYGKFERVFAINDQVDGDNISARCEDGVLEVVIPKVIENKEGKKIEVK